MRIKFQSETIPFDEFAMRHPDNTILVPVSHGLDGVELYTILIPFALDILKDILGYIAKKLIEQIEKEKELKEKAEKSKHQEVVIILPNEKAMHIAYADFDDIPSLLERIKNEIGQVPD